MKINLKKIRQILFVIVTLNIFNISFMFSQEATPCSNDCTGTWNLASYNINIQSCPGCSVTVFVKENDYCREYYIYSISILSSECISCFTYKQIFGLCVEWLLKYGKYSPATPGSTVVERISSGACWKPETSPANPWSLQLCSIEPCCKYIYNVTLNQDGSISVTQIGSLLINGYCYSPCFTMCPNPFVPRILLQENQDEINNSSDNTIKMSENGLKLSIISQEVGTLECILIGINGNIGIRQQGKINKNEPFLIDLTNLSSGVYLYQVLLNNQLYKKGKIIVNK